MEKVSIYTIAEIAGVSTATVSRALSGKSGVRAETRQRIIDIARDMEYRPSQLARRLSAADVNIAVLYSGEQFEEFGFDILKGAYDAGLDLVDYHVKVYLYHFPNVTTTSATSLMDDRQVNGLLDVLRSGIKGIINFPFPRNPEISQLFLDEIGKRDIYLANTVGGRTANNKRSIFSYYSDTYTAGAIAAEILWNALGDHGKVCIITAQKDNPIHQQGIRGFKDALKRYPLDLLDIYENYDDRQLSYYTADLMLRNHPELRGVYVGSANSVMICKRIAESENINKYCMVTSDLYPELVSYIENRLVRATIVQSQYIQSYETVHIMANYLTTHTLPEHPVRTVKPQVVMYGNVEQHLVPTDKEKYTTCLNAIHKFK
jgi:LacI family transcriptional regulator